MSNGDVCCILGVCCPPDSPTQRAALVTEIAHGTGVTEADASVFADWLTATFDLAPKGTLKDFKAAIAAMARQHPDQT